MTKSEDGCRVGHNDKGTVVTVVKFFSDNKVSIFYLSNETLLKKEGNVLFQCQKGIQVRSHDRRLDFVSLTKVCSNQIARGDCFCMPISLYIQSNS